MKEEDISPVLTLKERWIREFWETHRRGGVSAANAMLSRAYDDMATDELTDLYTPRAFRRVLAQILAPKMKRKYDEQHYPLGAVVFIDLDYFKRLNEMFGHAGGDEVLRVFGKKLKLQFRASDLIGRLGGDEFVIIADGLSVDMVHQRVESLKADLLEHHWRLERIDGGDQSPGSVLTFTSRVEEITDPEALDALIRKADIAVMKEKARRGQVE